MLEYQEYYRKLHSLLLKSDEIEKATSKRAKKLAVEVGNQRMEYDKDASKQFTNNTEIGELRREMLKIENEYKLASDRELRLSSDIQDATIQRNEILQEIEEVRKHKADMLEPQLIASTKEIKLDVIQRRNQIDNLQKDLEEKDATYEMCIKDRDRLEIERDKLALAISKAAEMPLKIMYIIFNRGSNAKF